MRRCCQAIARRIRAAWRARFAPDPPPRLDGHIIQLRTLLTYLPFGDPKSDPDYFAKWEAQRAIRGVENEQRKAAWRRGERVP